MNIVQKIKILWYRLLVAGFSPDSYFRRKKAFLEFSFPADYPNPDTAFRIHIDDMTYWFEGTPEIEEYQLNDGRKRKGFVYKYGGWELDFHPKQKAEEKPKEDKG